MKSEHKRRVYYDPCQEKVYEKKGVAYCEHYPEGLPVCGKCREESTLAHDKACALLAEARAEIERLKSESMRVTPGQMVFDNLQKELSRKDKLIEQMREALKIAAPCVKEIFGYHSKDYVEIKAALAAERGE